MKMEEIYTHFSCTKPSLRHQIQKIGKFRSKIEIRIDLLFAYSHTKYTFACVLLIASDGLGHLNDACMHWSWSWCYRWPRISSESGLCIGSAGILAFVTAPALHVSALVQHVFSITFFISLIVNIWQDANFTTLKILISEKTYKK